MSGFQFKLKKVLATAPKKPHSLFVMRSTEYATTYLTTENDEEIEVEGTYHKGAAATRTDPEEFAYFEIDKASIDGKPYELNEDEEEEAKAKLLEGYEPEEY